MNYAEMSDYQINNLIHNHEVCDGEYRLEFMDDGRIKWTHGNGLAVVTGHKKYDENLKDYCNNPADIWPLIVESEISILVGKECSAFAFHKVNRDAEDRPCGYDFSFSCKNALRAAAIVYLMMKEAGK